MLACAPMVAYGAQQSRPEEVKVFVIVETDNRWRGHEVIVGVMGPYETEERALEVNAELRAVLPSQYESHDENPTDYTVFRLSPFWVVSDRAAEVAS